MLQYAHATHRIQSARVIVPQNTPAQDQGFLLQGQCSVIQAELDVAIGECLLQCRGNRRLKLKLLIDDFSCRLQDGLVDQISRSVRGVDVSP